ncbi:MAG: hypothetical protein SGPRY_003634 [Prymnesium sp.]
MGVLKLQQRKASDLPTCALTRAIEQYMNEDLQRMGKVARNVVVRLVSNKSYSYHVMGEMKERYGDGYPDSFPYQSKLLLAFQTIEHRDVLCFGMYVQEYGSHCPQPNTNRTYISYLDSVPYMETQPEGERTAVYHGIINGYLKHACAMGFEYAHIWVAPPQSGDEYIFHCRPMHPKHGHKAMSMQKLRSWYEALLLKAKKFPLFYGDFFPEEIKKLLKGEEVIRNLPLPASLYSLSRPHRNGELHRNTSISLVKQMQKRAREVRRRFLVARLNTENASRISASSEDSLLSFSEGETFVDGREPAFSCHLADSRLSFLQSCISRHWQFNELRRAHYSTMMILAEIGGAA